MGNTDSKTQLHTALTKLASEAIPADQDATWSSFWQLPASTDIIFNTFNGNDLHDLRSKQPDNYTNLIRKVNNNMKSSYRLGDYALYFYKSFIVLPYMTHLTEHCLKGCQSPRARYKHISGPHR